MFVKPKNEGDLIRIPERDMRPLAADGEEVPDTQYWYRRIAQGDVIEIKKSAPSPTPVSAASEDHKKKGDK